MGPRKIALCAVGAALVAALAGGASARAESAAPKRLAWPHGVAAVGYSSQAALDTALARYPGRIVHRVPKLRVVEVRPSGSLERFVRGVAVVPGITYVERVAPRSSTAEPAVVSTSRAGAFQWQYAATRSNAVPSSVLRAAGSVTIAVIDTGADLSAPDLSAKAPTTYSVRTRTPDVRDTNGHGTFVASLAAGSVTNNDGVAGFGGDARLIVVKAGNDDGSFTDLDEASAIVYAVENGAKIINLSFGGLGTSTTERRAVDYAVERGVLLVAAVGNEYADGNPVEYPAALLQPPGSNGQGGRGLTVAASTIAGVRAAFSNTGSHLSLAAPGERVFGAVSSLAPESAFPRVALPGATGGFYGYGSGTSYAAPQVSGAAALVWAANPKLTAAEVAAVLKETAQGGGTWTPELGFGVIDVAAAVARAGGNVPAVPAAPSALRGDAILKLTASKTRGGRPFRLALTASLRATAPVPTQAREISLESFDGRNWTEAARGTTTRSGVVTWRFSLGPGTYKVRARYSGADDLTSATSRPVSVKVR